MRKFYILLFLTFSLTAKSQNLIHNSSFDDYSTYLDNNNNIVYQPNFWFYNSNNSNHPIYYSSDRVLNKIAPNNTLIDSQLVIQGHKKNYFIPVYASEKFQTNNTLNYLHPELELAQQGQKLNYISIVLLPKTQKAYSILKEPLKEGHKYYLQVDIKTNKQSNCLTDLIVGFKANMDFANKESINNIQLTLKDSSSYNYLIENWVTVSCEFTALGDEKVVVFGAGLEEDYINIIKSNRRKFYQSYIGGPFRIMYYIDNPKLFEISNNSLFVNNIDTMKIGDSFVLQNIYFDFDKYILLEKSFPMLNELIEYLKTKTNIRIQISGHTDNIGKNDYNNELSLKRAIAVTDYLISKGIAKERLQMFGFGSLYPINSNDTEYGRQQNRRIEIKIVDK